MDFVLQIKFYTTHAGYENACILEVKYTLGLYYKILLNFLYNGTNCSENNLNLPINTGRSRCNAASTSTSTSMSILNVWCLKQKMYDFVHSSCDRLRFECGDSDCSIFGTVHPTQCTVFVIVFVALQQ